MTKASDLINEVTTPRPKSSKAVEPESSTSLPVFEQVSQSAISCNKSAANEGLTRAKNETVTRIGTYHKAVQKLAHMEADAIQRINDERREIVSQALGEEEVDFDGFFEECEKEFALLTSPTA